MHVETDVSILPPWDTVFRCKGGKSSIHGGGGCASDMSKFSFLCFSLSPRCYAWIFEQHSLGLIEGEGIREFSLSSRPKKNVW